MFEYWALSIVLVKLSYMRDYEITFFSSVIQLRDLYL